MDTETTGKDAGTSPELAAGPQRIAVPINLLNSSEEVNPVVVEGGSGKVGTVWGRIPGLSGAGLILAIVVLGIIAVFVFFLIYNLVQDQSNEDIKTIISQNIPAANTDSAFAHKIELINTIQQRNKAHRDYTIQISQIVLLNLLLPILTGILGYIFGTREEKQVDSSEPH